MSEERRAVIEAALLARENTDEMGYQRGTDSEDTDAILWLCFRHFVARDHANAAVHCDDVRFSPITVRVAAVLRARQAPPPFYEDRDALLWVLDGARLT
jgi:hypothetical protein